MKAEELMIGDFLYLKNEVIVRVDMVGRSPCRKLWVIDKIEISTIENLDDVSPIPITPEILEKNGFQAVEYTSEYEEYVSANKRVRFNHLSNTADREWYCHVDNEDFESIGGADIQYVHELQHLFKLCRIDKEIEL